LRTSEALGCLPRAAVLVIRQPIWQPNSSRSVAAGS
jgi:hypothetical protein